MLAANVTITKHKETKIWRAFRNELMSGMQAARSDFIELNASEIINRNKQVSNEKTSST